jgi:hypothetical protein
VSANEREEDITGNDLAAEDAFETGDCILDEDQYNQPGQRRSFYEATMKQLGPLIQDCTCASLLRDTTISPDALNNIFACYIFKCSTMIQVCSQYNTTRNIVYYTVEVLGKNVITPIGTKIKM